MESAEIIVPVQTLIFEWHGAYNRKRNFYYEIHVNPYHADASLRIFSRSTKQNAQINSEHQKKVPINPLTAE